MKNDVHLPSFIAGLHEAAKIAAQTSKLGAKQGVHPKALLALDVLADALREIKVEDEQ
jgi:hypothetical protein